MPKILRGVYLSAERKGFFSRDCGIRMTSEGLRMTGLPMCSFLLLRGIKLAPPWL